MKFKTISISTIAFFLIASVISCSGGQTSSNSDTSNNGNNGFNLEQANSVLAGLTYSPYGKGFQYKSVAVPAGDFRNWLSKYKPKIQQALESVGEGYALQVTGHTDSSGPRNEEGPKKGNIWYSTQRAKNVYNALSSAGVPTTLITVQGVADDELLPGLDKYDQRHRRVTFKIVPK